MPAAMLLVPQPAQFGAMAFLQINISVWCPHRSRHTSRAASLAGSSRVRWRL